MSKLPKSARGTEPGDASNIVIRNILTGISRKVFGKFTQADIEETLRYFDYKCPYTDRDLRQDIEKGENYAIDHIVPQNKECCGLNVMGNLVYADKIANQKKSSKTVEDFLLNDNTVLAGVSQAERQRRLNKIKQFQKDCGYNPDQIRNAISPYLFSIYDEVGVEQEKRIDKAIGLAGLTPAPQNVVTKKKNSSKNQPEIVLNPSSIEDFKKELLVKKEANIILTYETGNPKMLKWKANNFNADSDLLNNIKSRPFWRTKNKDGLIKVEIRLQ
ncbi:MAG: hypothetical protein IJR08_02080 [Bacilli bacterium]|nr:hypothetical protein [Bacilli bacterium]